MKAPTASGRNGRQLQMCEEKTKIPNSLSVALFLIDKIMQISAEMGSWKTKETDSLVWLLAK